MPIPVVGENLFRALAEAGVLSDPERVRRVVIDLEAGCVPLVHVEQYGDERLLSVLPAISDGAQVVREEGPKPDLSEFDRTYGWMRGVAEASP